MTTSAATLKIGSFITTTPETYTFAGELYKCGVRQGVLGHKCVVPGLGSAFRVHGESGETYYVRADSAATHVPDKNLLATTAAFVRARRASFAG